MITSGSKLSDVVAGHMEVLPVLERFGIKLGFGEATVGEICSRYGISQAFFIMLCRVYADKGYTPGPASLGNDDIKDVLTYLRCSHTCYINTWFPVLHKHIHALLDGCDELNETLVNRFYDEYDSEMSRHFDYEDKVVFPYVEGLLEGRKEGDFTIGKFLANHTDIDVKLDDLKSIIIKYLPEQYSSQSRYDLLSEVAKIEDDHEKHTIIEEKVLVPLVLRLEKTVK